MVLNIFIIMMILILIYLIMDNFEYFYTSDNIYQTNDNIYQTNDNIYQTNNLFNTPLQNIFLTDNNLNYIDNKPITVNPDYKSLSDISVDSYIYSNTSEHKIICSNYTNQGDCWDNNNCQWIHKIDGGSYCELAPKWLL